MTFAEKLRELIAGATAGKRTFGSEHMCVIPDGESHYKNIARCFPDAEDSPEWMAEAAFYTHLANNASAIAAVVEAGAELRKCRITYARIRHVSVGETVQDARDALLTAEGEFDAALSALNRTGGGNESHQEK